MIKLRELFIVYFVVFVGFFGYALTVTVFVPVLLMSPHSTLLPASAPTSLRVTLSGMLLAMYPLGQFLGSPVIGHLSDHYGRKKVLVISLCGCFVGFVGMALSIEWGQLALLFVSAGVTGLCESNMAIAQSVIADTIESTHQRTKLMGYAYSACSLGYITSPLLAGAAGTLAGHSAPFWVTALGVLGLIFWVMFRFNDHSKPEKDTKIRWFESLTSLRSIVSQRALYKIYCINFLVFFCSAGAISRYPFIHR